MHHDLYVDTIDDIKYLVDEQNGFKNPKLTPGTIVYVLNEDAHYYVKGNLNDPHGVIGYSILTSNNNSSEEDINTDLSDLQINTVFKDNNLYISLNANDHLTQLPEVSIENAGLMTPEDKQKLDNITENSTNGITDVILDIDSNKINTTNGNIAVIPVSNTVLDSENLITGKAVKIYTDSITNDINNSINELGESIENLSTKIENIIIETDPIVNIDVEQNEKLINVYKHENIGIIKSTELLRDAIERANTAVQSVKEGNSEGSIEVDKKQIKIPGWNNLKQSIQNIENTSDDKINNALNLLSFFTNIGTNERISSIEQIEGKINVIKEKYIDTSVCRMIHLQQADYNTLVENKEIVNNYIYVINDIYNQPIRVYLGTLLFADKNANITAFPYTFPIIF